MQFPVPQFTDVEDKIIGNITLKQFIIILVTGVFIFLAYSASKDLLITGFVGVLIGIPGLVLAFGSFNGRTLYNQIPVFINYVTRPKFFVFHKEALDSQLSSVKTVELKQETVPENQEDTRTRLKRIQYQLERRAAEEEEIINKAMEKAGKQKINH